MGMGMWKGRTDRGGGYFRSAAVRNADWHWLADKTFTRLGR